MLVCFFRIGSIWGGNCHPSGDSTGELLCFIHLRLEVLFGQNKNKILRSWSIMFGLVELEFRLDGEGEGCNLNFFLHILSSLVNIRLHTENWLCNLPGSALQVPVGGGGGCLKVNLVISFG